MSGDKLVPEFLANQERAGETFRKARKLPQRAPHQGYPMQRIPIQIMRLERKIERSRERERERE
eukprot:661875-Amorphochlora_amoeboformis.AAC.1